MLENIIDSKVKAKILKVFAKREGPLHVSEVARLAKVSKSRASECLRELAEKGILESRVAGRNVTYSLSSSILAQTIVKSLTQEEILLSEISKSLVGEIRKLKPESVALFGSALKGLKLESDIDIIVITHREGLQKEKFYGIASKLTEKFGLRISILVMDKNEFKEKAKRGEEFIVNVLANHKLLYGKKLEDLVW